MPHQWTPSKKAVLAFGMALAASHMGAGRVPAADETDDLLQRFQPPDQPGTLRAPCSGDERIRLARDSRIGIGRITATYPEGTVFCTAFILSNGAFVTAGHCVDTDNDEVVDPEFLAGQVQFNVPDSTFNGCAQIDGSTRIYPIDRVVDFQLIKILGIPIPPKDWAVFTVQPDALQNLAAMTEGFLRPDDDGPILLSTMRVTGYGNDTHPANAGLCNGFPKNGNSSAYTLQTDTGILEFFVTNEIGHRADTEGGTSGGPIIQDSTGRVIGIHNSSTCGIQLFNAGVAFTKNNLADAINGFQGANAVHLDAAAASGGDGSIFEPLDNLDDAVDATPLGGKLVIVAGSYSGSTTIDKQIEIVTPVGGVTLGD